VVSKQAQARHCFVCGVDNPTGLRMKFYDLEPGIVEATYTVEERFQGYPGVVHGGIIASMMDEVMGRVFMGGGATRFMVTAELKLRYRKPVPVGKPLILRGKAVTDNGRVGRAEGYISDENGDILVQGEIVVANIPAALQSIDSVSDTGWQVYPDEE